MYVRMYVSVCTYGHSIDGVFTPFCMLITQSLLIFVNKHLNPMEIQLVKIENSVSNSTYR